MDRVFFMLIIDEKCCLSCAGCIGLCPEAALFHDLTGLKADTDICTLCGICVMVCPVQALMIDCNGAGT